MIKFKRYFSLVFIISQCFYIFCFKNDNYKCNKGNISIKVKILNNITLSKNYINKINLLYCSYIDALKKGNNKKLTNIIDENYKKDFLNSIVKEGEKYISKSLLDYFGCVNKVEIGISEFENKTAKVYVKFYCKNKYKEIFSEEIKQKGNILKITQSCVGNNLDCN